MFVAVMAFYAKVSDPTVGGTYMTLLNTVSNLGTNWPNTLALWAIDHLTFKSCSSPELSDNTCSTDEESKVNNLLCPLLMRSSAFIWALVLQHLISLLLQKNRIFSNSVHKLTVKSLVVFDCLRKFYNSSKINM